MGVIHHQRAAELVAVVEDDRASGVAELRRVRMRDRLAVDAARLTGNAANGIEVVDRVVDQLEPRRADHERPQMPRLFDHEVQIDVGQLAERAALEQRPKRQHRRAEAQLQVDRRGHAARLAGAENPAGFFEIAPHRLLDQHGGAVRQLLEDADDLIARQGQVEHRLRHARRVAQRGQGRHAELCRRVFGRRGIDVEDASEWKGQPPIGRNVRGANDPAAANEHDRPGRGGARPGLGQIGHRSAILIHWAVTQRVLRGAQGSGGSQGACSTGSTGSGGRRFVVH